jgi:capsular exopolysaccharide synthesis family protein
MLPPEPKALAHKAAAAEVVTAVAAAAPAAPAAAPPSMGALAQALRRCWPRAVILSLVAAAAGVAGVLLAMPPQYSAVVLLHVSSRPPRGEGEPEFVNYQRTQSALVKSYTVLHAALEKPDVAALPEVRAHADPLAWLQKALVTDFTLGPEVLRVTLSGDHAEQTALLLNEVANAYLAEVARKDGERVAVRVKQLQDNYRRAAELLREKRLKLRAREQELDVDDPETAKARQGSVMGQLTAAQAKRLNLRLDMKQAEVELAAERDRAGSPGVPTITEAAVEEELKQGPLGARQLADLAVAQQRVLQTMAVTTPEAREEQLKGPLARRNAILEALKAQKAEVRVRLEAKLKAKARADVRDNIARLENKIKLLKVQQAALDGEVRRLEVQAEQLRGAGRAGDKPMSELDALRDDVGQTEMVLKKVGDELGTLQAEWPATPRVTLLEEAAPPASKKVDRQAKLAGVAGAGLFGCVLLGVALLETRSRRVYATRDVAGSLALGVVGTLPALPASARGAVPVPGDLPGHAGQGAMTEAIDAIRTVLLHSPRGEAPRVLMVTSALGGEGKTTLATHLAASLARAWRKTLLIDCDLRNPGAHRQFDLAVEPGMSEALRGEVEFEDAVRPTLVSRLWLLPAGKFDSHAVQALAQDGVRNVFERLKEEYDFIVIDTSPVLPVADALLVAQHADAALFAVLRDVSRIPSVQAAHQRLAALGVRTLGAVVIGEEPQTYGQPVPYPRKA